MKLHTHWCCTANERVEEWIERVKSMREERNAWHKKYQELLADLAIYRRHCKGCLACGHDPACEECVETKTPQAP